MNESAWKGWLEHVIDPRQGWALASSLVVAIQSALDKIDTLEKENKDLNTQTIYAKNLLSESKKLMMEADCADRVNRFKYIIKIIAEALDENDN